MAVPTRETLLKPLIEALQKRGGSASNPEQLDEIANLLQLAEEDINETQEGTRSKFDYNLAWARTHLKHLGLITNSERGIWSLTAKGWKSLKSPSAIDVAIATGGEEEEILENDIPSMGEFAPSSIGSWRIQLLRHMLKMSPKSFEHLCMRVLRESGFVNVEVTNYSKDGGIDGRGIARFEGLLSFFVAFQCKRYAGVVGAPEVQAFRGAWIGQADRGLLITTGRFTGPAQAEALRPGAPPIDLLDGYMLADKMKELHLGVNTRLVEEVAIDLDFFKTLDP